MTQQLLPESPEKAQQHVARREPRSDSASSFQGGLHPIFQLQRMLGNRRVAQLIQAKQLTPEGKITGLRRKLPAGTVDDQHEQEAGRVARQVMDMPNVVVSNSAQRAFSLEKDKDRRLQPESLAVLRRQRAAAHGDEIRAGHTTHQALDVDMDGRVEGRNGAGLQPIVLQRDQKKKDEQVLQDFAVLLSPDKNFVTIATAIAPGAKILHATSVEDLVKQLKAIKGPVGTLYFVAHMDEDGDLLFTSPGREEFVPAETIASKIKNAVKVENIDLRGCNVAQSPAEMDKIRVALTATKITGSTCTLVNQISDPIKIGGKAITQPKDLNDKNRAAFDTGFKKVRELFVDAKKKCIINDSVDGYFQTGGRLIAYWANPGSMADEKGWNDKKSICYKDLKVETVDPTKKLPVFGPDDCKLVELGKK